MEHIEVYGKHSYGINNITVKQWGEGAKLYVGSFNSIAANVEAYIGGNHRADCFNISVWTYQYIDI